MHTLHTSCVAMWPDQAVAESVLGGASVRAWLDEEGAGRANGSQVCVPAPYLSQERANGIVWLLQLTTDMPLAMSRAGLLGKAGFDVVTALEGDAPAYLRKHHFAVALFCQTIKSDMAARLAEYFRSKHRSTITARLTFAQAQEQAYFDTVLAAPVAPAELVQAAARWKHRYLSGVQ